MRIAFAMINCNRRDGSARAVNEVAERMASRGHEVHLFARTAREIDLSAVRLHRIPGPGWPEVADFWTYRQWVDRALSGKDFDIVHSIGCNTSRANVVTIQNIQPAKERILRRFGNEERVGLPRRFTRRLYLRVTCAAEAALYNKRKGKLPPVFLAVSRGVAAELRAEYDIGDAPVRIVPNAADVEVFRPLEPFARERWREANGIAKGAIACIFCGGEWRRKGLDSAIRAIGKVRRDDVVLYVAGEDSERAAFERLAGECGVGDRVFFGGFRADIATALAACDLFLFPSHYEAFSLATIEAAACGLPLLVTRINGAEDFIRHGETGEFIGHDADETAAAVRRLAENPEERRKMGAAARALVEQRYTWDRVADMTEEAYRFAVEHGAGGGTGGGA